MSKAAEIRSQIRELVWAGRKIEAVKLYRDMTWASLLDAKNAVEAIAEGREPDQNINWLDDLYQAIENGDFETSVLILEQNTPLDRAAAEKQLRSLFAQYSTERVYGPMSDEEAHQEIVILVKAKKKLEAIKLYKAQTGQGLAESKAAVEQIEREFQAKQTSSSNTGTATSGLSDTESTDEFDSTRVGLVARLLAFIYAAMAIVGLAFAIALSWGQPRTVQPCKIAEDLPADQQLVQILDWKLQNVPSTSNNLFVENRFMDYYFEAGLPARAPFLEDTWDNKLRKVTQCAERATSAFWRSINYFVLLYSFGLLFAVWACIKPKIRNSLPLLIFALAGYPNIAELPLRFHCDHAGRWFIPLIFPAALMLLIVLFARGMGSRSKQL
ncbi:MAG: hypothetical protein U0930_16160 [Pirellulales bacterium]